MNYLVIIFILFLLIKGKNGDLKTLLNGITKEDVAPLLNVLSSSNLLENFPIANVLDVVNGNFNINGVLPLITTVLSSFNGNTSNVTPTVNSGDGVSPINNLFASELTNELKNYFEN